MHFLLIHQLLHPFQYTQICLSITFSFFKIGRVNQTGCRRTLLSQNKKPFGSDFWSPESSRMCILLLFNQHRSNMAWRQITAYNRKTFSTPSNLISGFASFSSKSTPFLVKVGIPEFLKGVGKGVESHVEKLESEIGDLHKLLVARTLKLKKLGIPCKQRKLILKFAHKYRVGLWRPRADLVKS